MHYAEQVFGKRAKQSGMAEERQKSIGITIDICRRLGEYLEKSHKKISPPLYALSPFCATLISLMLTHYSLLRHNSQKSHDNLATSTIRTNVPATTDVVPCVFYCLTVGCIRA